MFRADNPTSADGHCDNSFSKVRLSLSALEILHLYNFFRCEADVVINNIFKVFDIGSSGKVVPQELLLAFSMSMKGSGRFLRTKIM